MTADQPTAGTTAPDSTAPDSTAPADTTENGQDANGSGAASEDQVRDKLRTVFDPEIGINIVDLGLIYEIAVEGAKVRVVHTLTTPACPVGPMIRAQIEQAVSNLDGVEAVAAELVFSPPWDPREMCSDEAKFELGIF